MRFNLRSRECSNNRALVLGAAILMLSGGPGLADSHEVTSGAVRAVCRLSPAGRFEAKSAALVGVVALSAERGGQLEGELTLDLQTLETGIGLRDSHLRDYLEVQEPGNQLAVLTGIHVEQLSERGFASGTYPFRGRMRLHGREDEVSGKVEIRADGLRLHAEAVFPMRLSDFAISRPAYLGVGVKDELTVHVNLTAVVADGSATLQDTMR